MLVRAYVSKACRVCLSARHRSHPLDGRRAAIIVPLLPSSSSSLCFLSAISCSLSILELRYHKLSLFLMIPHPTIPVLEIRPTDIWALLAVGALVEILSRSSRLFAKTKYTVEVTLEQDYQKLQLETAQKRRLGPPAFVETSKLERKVLQAEKKLAGLQQERQARVERVQKLIKNASLSVYVLIFIVYYGIPMVSLDGLKVDSDNLESTSEERARFFLNSLLFPISYIGMGVKIAKIGISQVGIGALVVLWSSQVTIGKLMDCVEIMV